MAKTKVFHLIKTLNLGGAELNLFNLVQEFDPERFTIHIGYSLGGEFEEKFRKSGVKLFKFARGNHKVKSFASLLILSKLIVYILRNKIDIVHTHTFTVHIWGSIAAKITGVKLVEHVHDSRYLPPEEFKKRKEFNRQYRYIKFFKNVSDKVIVLTRQNYDFLLSKKLYEEKRVKEIQNGIRLSGRIGFKEEQKKALKHKLNIKEDSPVILTPSRISPEKNIDLILDIAPQVRKECPGAVFVISGDGPLFEEFKAKCRVRKLEETVRMPGFYRQGYDLLNISDIFLLPSFIELHSIAVLEALSVKVPVVVSRVGSNGQFIRNWYNGVLLDPFENAGWPEAIVELLGNAELRRSLGEKGYDLCRQRFDIKNTVKEIRKIYAELIG